MQYHFNKGNLESKPYLNIIWIYKYTDDWIQEKAKVLHTGNNIRLMNNFINDPQLSSLTKYYTVIVSQYEKITSPYSNPFGKTQSS